MKNITGTVTYVDVETGCWGIIGKSGKKWRPVNMPEQLKLEGKKVELTITVIKGEMSTIQWGTPVLIESFTT